MYRYRKARRVRANIYGVIEKDLNRLGLEAKPQDIPFLVGQFKKGRYDEIHNFASHLIWTRTDEELDRAKHPGLYKSLMEVASTWFDTLKDTNHNARNVRASYVYNVFDEGSATGNDPWYPTDQIVDAESPVQALDKLEDDVLNQMLDAGYDSGDKAELVLWQGNTQVGNRFVQAKIFQTSRNVRTDQNDVSRLQEFFASIESELNQAKSSLDMWGIDNNRFSPQLQNIGQSLVAIKRVCSSAQRRLDKIQG